MGTERCLHNRQEEVSLALAASCVTNHTPRAPMQRKQRARCYWQVLGIALPRNTDEIDERCETAEKLHLASQSLYLGLAAS
jgi:hypothetical protein